MQAWQVQEHGEPRRALRRVDVEAPIPQVGELRVRVEAAAIGMPDVFMCRGTYPLTPPLPFIGGQEVCGVVDAVGDAVELSVGTRIMGVTTFFDGRGGFAEETILSTGTAFRVPDEMTSTVAAAFRIGYSTAWTALVERGRLQRGETLVVLGGAGGSGMSAIQLGGALGARVIAVAAGREKVDFCQRLGAAVVIDRTTVSVRDAILAATDGRGADIVFDPVGGDVASDALRATRRLWTVPRRGLCQWRVDPRQRGRTHDEQPFSPRCDRKLGLAATASPSPRVPAGPFHPGVPQSGRTSATFRGPARWSRGCRLGRRHGQGRDRGQLLNPVHLRRQVDDDLRTLL